MKNKRNDTNDTRDKLSLKYDTLSRPEFYTNSPLRYIERDTRTHIHTHTHTSRCESSDARFYFQIRKYRYIPVVGGKRFDFQPGIARFSISKIRVIYLFIYLFIYLPTSSVHVHAARRVNRFPPCIIGQNR